jgi:hypothetical protein
VKNLEVPFLTIRYAKALKSPACFFAVVTHGYRDKTHRCHGNSFLVTALYVYNVNIHAQITE